VLRQPFPRPSRLLAQHAQWLAAQELSGTRPWEQWIVRGQSGLPAFARPPDDTDVLYLTDDAEHPVPHPDPAESGHRPGWPKVHHGFIGSADRSLRNARIRDTLAAKYDLRAFEMEGKGVGDAAFANGLEWLVVRGVSDYGDSHTNTRWRKYASLVAAAYTRALLAECPPVGPRGGHTGGVRSVR
jgi:nucleoside phosphorylase